MMRKMKLLLGSVFLISTVWAENVILHLTEAMPFILNQQTQEAKSNATKYGLIKNGITDSFSFTKNDSVLDDAQFQKTIKEDICNNILFQDVSGEYTFRAGNYNVGGYEVYCLMDGKIQLMDGKIQSPIGKLEVQILKTDMEPIGRVFINKNPKLV